MKQDQGTGLPYGLTFRVCQRAPKRWANAGANSVSWGFTRNPASQILSETQSNDAYSWNAHAVADRTYAANGLNEYTAAGSASFCHDANGNLTADGSHVYLYDVENRLVEMRAQLGSTCPSYTSGFTGTMVAALRYDPLGRLDSTAVATARR